jgi:hypothetical protein
MPTVFIDTDGTTTGLASPVTQLLRLGDRQRVSHVEPCNWLLRQLFHLIRIRVTDESALAAFTRQWSCRWQANIFNGPTLGPFRRRETAIAAEIHWINQELERTNHVQATDDRGTDSLEQAH